jgi:hypothetical protein
LPDGLALHVAAGRIYRTNMGDPERNDGSIVRSDLNGKNMITAPATNASISPMARFINAPLLLLVSCVRRGPANQPGGVQHPTLNLDLIAKGFKLSLSQLLSRL